MMRDAGRRFRRFCENVCLADAGASGLGLSGIPVRVQVRIRAVHGEGGGESARWCSSR